MGILAADEKIAVWHRWLDGGDVSGGSHVLVFANFGENAVQTYSLSNVPVDGKWKVQFNGDARHYSSLYHDGCASQREFETRGGQGSICLPGASLLIVSSSHLSVTSLTSTTSTTDTTTTTSTRTSETTTVTSTTSTTTRTNTTTTTGNSSTGRECSAHAECFEAGLTGNCCPTSNGTYFSCCEGRAFTASFEYV